MTVFLKEYWIKGVTTSINTFFKLIINETGQWHISSALRSLVLRRRVAELFFLGVKLILPSISSPIQEWNLLLNETFLYEFLTTVWWSRSSSSFAARRSHVFDFYALIYSWPHPIILSSYHPSSSLPYWQQKSDLIPQLLYQLAEFSLNHFKILTSVS